MSVKRRSPSINTAAKTFAAANGSANLLRTLLVHKCRASNTLPLRRVWMTVSAGTRRQRWDRASRSARMSPPRTASARTARTGLPLPRSTSDLAGDKLSSHAHSGSSGPM